MNRFFGSSKPAVPKPTLNDVIATTDSRADTVSIKIRKLDVELSGLKEQISKVREGPGKQALKTKALRVLKQRKLYEGQRDSLTQQSFNMEQAQMSTENLKNTFVTLDAMQSANKEMKKQYKKINIEKIEAMQDEMEDLMEQANEVQESLSRSYAVDDIDESELEAELEALGDDLCFENDAEPSYLVETPAMQDFPATAKNDPMALPGALPEKQLVPERY